MSETLVSASTAGLVEMIQTWRWSNKFLEYASSLRSPSPLPPLGIHPHDHDVGGQVCRQLYTEHKLLSLTADGQLEVDSFKVGLDQPVEYVHPKISKFEYFKELLVYPYATNAFVRFETRQSNFCFQLPSACACFVREDFMLEFRFSRQKLTS